MSKKEEKQVDVLDQFKKAEKAIKANLLIKSMSRLKVLAKEVLRAKEETEIILKEIGISGKDIKRIIDFINSFPETSLTDEEIKELTRKGRSSLRENRKEVEEKFSDITFVGSGFTMDSSHLSSVTTTADSNLNFVSMSDTSKSLDIQI